jgi:hypothetical protein
VITQSQQYRAVPGMCARVRDGDGLGHVTGQLMPVALRWAFFSGGPFGEHGDCDSPACHLSTKGSADILRIVALRPRFVKIIADYNPYWLLTQQPNSSTVSFWERLVSEASLGGGPVFKMMC